MGLSSANRRRREIARRRHTAAPQTQPEPNQDINDMTVPELQAVARDLGVNVTGLRKLELLGEIRARQG